MQFESLSILNYQDVFEIWRENEEHLQHWQEFLKNKGYSSWEEWRKEHAMRFRINDLNWMLCAMNESSATLNLRGGPFKGWKNNYYEGSVMPTFEEIATRDNIRNHKDIREISENFPNNTIITALDTGDRGVFVIEGMHRCTALALALGEGRNIEPDIYVALAHCSYKFIEDLYLDL